jgi:hypothetical protein
MVKLLVLILFIASCREREVIITRQYVINSNWTEGDNSLAIWKMKLHDSSQVIDVTNPTETELLDGLTIDSGFCYMTNVQYNGEKFSERKVFFDRYNGFSWCSLKDRHSGCHQKTIGELQRSTWYLLSGLSNVRKLHYVYVDSLDHVRVSRVNAITNY